MNDLISRSALIEYLEKVTVTEGITFETGFKQILTDIKNQPTVEAKPVEWILCSERLPENEKLLYWTTHEDGTVMLHGWLKTNGFIYNWEVDDLEKRKRMGQVVAWMPIFEPEPYKE